jgi:hypothetical protein
MGALEARQGRREHDVVSYEGLRMKDKGRSYAGGELLLVFCEAAI